MSETIVVERVTDTGVLVDGTWWNFSRFGKKPEMADGGTYEVEAKEFKGKKYISKAVPVDGGIKAKAPASAYKPAAIGITGASKDRRILVQGIMQACLQSPGLTGFAVTADEYLAVVEKATDRMVASVLSRASE